MSSAENVATRSALGIVLPVEDSLGLDGACPQLAFACPLALGNHHFRPGSSLSKMVSQLSENELGVTNLQDWNSGTTTVPLLQF
ncbi:hypothetical protein [Mesorhizobium sp. LCM 4577]|uniref:hypothetical protein n=1 Tax=Mesorhizobium sp. LCM 4577 TaxID=1848288 RepID=UPI0018E3813D|nr:hypothetical protein [Mesorhizobium sp. LCM 4577]